jgi:hypothetical protein
MKVNLHIKNLILHGISLTPTDRAELAATIQRQLADLISDEENIQSWIDLDDREQIQAQTISYRPATSSDRLGREIALSLFRSLQKGSLGKQRERL